MGATPKPQVSLNDYWKTLEIQIQAVNAINKTQTRYLHWILGALAVLWSWHVLRPTATEFDFLGVKLPTTFLWTLAPAVLTWLTLTLAGAINAASAVHRRIKETADLMDQNLWWSDLDLHRNVIDYFAYLRIRPSARIEAKSDEPYKRYSITHFLYPAVFAASVYTTLVADFPGSSATYCWYTRAMAGVQLLFVYRNWYRGVCRFLGIRMEEVTF